MFFRHVNFLWESRIQKQSEQGSGEPKSHFNQALLNSILFYQYYYNGTHHENDNKANSKENKNKIEIFASFQLCEIMQIQCKQSCRYTQDTNQNVNTKEGNVAEKKS